MGTMAEAEVFGLGRRALDRQRRAALVALAAAAVLVPWTLWLTRTLPSRYLVSNWDTTWIGFDVALLAALAAAGLATWRGHPASSTLCVLAATLLTCDAWFDVTTAAAGSDLVLSLLTAALVELPLAAALLTAAATERAHSTALWSRRRG
jgi:hypothetical protein